MLSNILPEIYQSCSTTVDYDILGALSEDSAIEWRKPKMGQCIFYDTSNRL